MGAPFIQGQYGYAELYAKQNRVFYYNFNVPDGSQAVNLNSYAALRLNVADSQMNTIISLTTNASGLSVINTNYVTINANAVQMNVSNGYYAFDLDGLASSGWQPVSTGTLRIDAT